MALNTAELLAGLPNMATTTPSAIHAQTLEALKRVGATIPRDFACWVLLNMPPTAALQGLGVMGKSQSSNCTADLNGYIRSCLEQEKNGYVGAGTAYTGVNDRVLEYIRCKEYCTGRASLCWRVCAVGALIRTAQGGVNLAHLLPDGGDGPYLDLVDIEPAWSYVVQPSPMYQAIQQSERYEHAGFDFLPAELAGYQPPAGLFQQEQEQEQSPYMDAGARAYQPPVGGRPQQGPYMVGGIPVFDLSHFPEPNPAGSAPPRNRQLAHVPTPPVQQAMHCYSPGYPTPSTAPLRASAHPGEAPSHNKAQQPSEPPSHSKALGQPHSKTAATSPPLTHHVPAQPLSSVPSPRQPSLPRRQDRRPSRR